MVTILDTPAEKAKGPGGARPPFARIRRTLLVVFALLLLVLAAGVLRYIHDSRTAALDTATRQNQMLARIIEEHLARTFGEADKVLQDVAERLAALGGPQAIGEKAAHEMLTRRQARLPQVAFFGVLQSDGVLMARATEYPLRPVGMSGQEDFIHHRDHGGETTYIGPMIKNPYGPGQVIFLSRRITLPDGRFGGIARSGISTEYLVRFYEELKLPPESVVALFKPDGSLLFRLPAIEEPARHSVSGSAAFQDGRPAGRMGVFEHDSPLDGRKNLLAYRWLPDESLGVFVGQPLQRVYAASQREALRAAVGGLLVAVVFAALFRLVFRYLRREETLSTQRRAAERALHDSEAKYRALVENIPQRVFYKDLQSRYLAVNRQYAADKGLTPGEIVGKDDFALSPPELAEKYRADDLRVMAGGKPQAHDETIVREGQRHLIHTVKTPVRDDRGEVVGVCGIYEDVTEQRRLQERLQESEAGLRAVFENVREGILVADADSRRFVMANPAVCRMFGYSLEEMLALSPFDLHPSEIHARIEAAFSGMDHGRYAPGVEMHAVRKDGSRFYIHISTTSYLLGGRPSYLGVLRDVTDIRRAREALERSEERLREAQRMAHLGHWEHDRTLCSLRWSDETYRIFEIEAGQFGESFEALLAAVHPEDREKIRAAAEKALAGRTPYDITYRLLFAGGRIKYVHDHGQTEYAEDGRPLRTFGTVQDVTAQVRAEEEIRVLNDTLERRVAERTEELARANRELESFSYSVSHDLRAPLRAINGFSRILQDSEEFAVSGDSRDLLERIVRNTNRMGELIDDILEYSRASQTALKRAEVDLTALARDVWDAHAAAHPGAAVRIGRLGSAWGDAATLRQVFDNLVANALKYSGKREKPEIEIGAQETPDMTTVYVRDNGTGFDMQYAGKLFGMFQRMHTDRDFPGTGVGLAICKRILERHGGRIWAEAAPDAGATFWFSLPKKPAQT
ncbi:MAG: PAS domain S-box protein [Burkholderiales bacterium]|nr:Adaptive-response sensory-kinase SasA [Rhodocyclaceae bacterium]MCZ2419298.1 PAS domain S-box protein [Burkholderiales bacterium]